MLGKESAIEGFTEEEYGLRIMLVDKEGSNIVAIVIAQLRVVIQVEMLTGGCSILVAKFLFTSRFADYLSSG